MKSYVQPGDIVDLVAPAAGFVSGVITRVGAFIGVPQCTVPAGEVGAVKLTGVFELQKVQAQAWSQGDRIYLSATNLMTNVSAAGLYPVGVATENEANPSPTGRVRLNGVAAVAVA